MMFLIFFHLLIICTLRIVGFIAEEKLKTVVINSGLSLNGNGNIDFGPFNKLKFLFYKMGAINSLHYLD